MERRKHPRFRTKFDVLCSSGGTEGAGTLMNISRSGAQLASANLVPEIGTKIRLYIFIQPVCPFELAGEVVRVFDVEGMCCGGCAPKVFKALTAQPGVRAAAVDFDSHTARAIVPADADVAALERALTFDDYVAKARP